MSSAEAKPGQGTEKQESESMVKFTLAPGSLEGSYLGSGAEFEATVNRDVKVGDVVMCGPLMARVRITSFDAATKKVKLTIV